VSAGGCQVTYTIASQWPGGFNADVTITSTGPAIDGWTLGFSFPGDQRIANAWNTTLTQDGRQVSAANANWNGHIPAGGSASFGFTASFSGTNAAPTAFTVNGHPCTAG
jgi:cellulase/cellobiase CelA1